MSLVKIADSYVNIASRYSALTERADPGPALALQQAEEGQDNSPAHAVFNISELLFQIFRDVPIDDLPAIALTCRQWSQVISDPVFCKRRFVLDFPFFSPPVRDEAAAYRSCVQLLRAVRKNRQHVALDEERSRALLGGFGMMLIKRDRLVFGSVDIKAMLSTQFLQFDRWMGNRSQLYVYSTTAISMDRDLVFTGHLNGKVLAWEFKFAKAQWRQRGIFLVGRHQVTALVESGEFLVIGDILGRIHLWSRSGKRISSCFAHLQGIRFLLKSESSIFSAGADGIILEWGISKGEIVTKTKFHRNRKPITALHDFHGMLLASGEDGSIAIWQKREEGIWECKEVLEQGLASICALASHGNFVFCATAYAELKVWEYERGEWRCFDLEQESAFPRCTVHSLCYDPESHELHCAHRNGNVSVWRFSGAAKAQLATHTASRGS